MIEGPVVEQFYYILETFLILWLYQQSIKYFAIYEEKINCASKMFQITFLFVKMQTNVRKIDLKPNNQNNPSEKNPAVQS